MGEEDEDARVSLLHCFYLSLSIFLSFRYPSPIRESPAVARCSSLNNRLGCLVFSFRARRRDSVRSSVPNLNF